MMAQIATCTSCHQQVTIPEGVDAGESVRCPHCEAEYALIAVLFHAVKWDERGEIPPELVPIAAGPAQDEAEGPSEVADEASAEVEAEPDDAASTAEEAAEVDPREGPPAGSDSEEPAPETEPPDLETEASGREVEGMEEGPEEPSDEVVDSAEETDEAATTREEDDEQDEGEETAEEGEEVTVVSDEPTWEEPPAEEAAVAEEEVPEGQVAQEGAAKAESEAEAAPPESPGKADQHDAVAVRCPHCQAECPLSEMIVVRTGEALGIGAADAAARVAFGVKEDRAAVPGLEVWARVDAMPQIDLGGDTGPQPAAVETGAFDFAKEETEGATAAEHAPRAKRRRKQTSVFRTLIGPVLGGLGGVVIAYYLLNWIRPESGNFLEIPLPGIPHTYRYSPDWFPAFLKPAPEPEEALEDELGDFQEPEVAAPSEGEDGATLRAEAQPPASVMQPTGGSGVGAAVPQPPQPKALPEGGLGPLEPPSYTADELGEALNAASQSLGEPVGEVSEEAYRRMCRLAEVMTFVDSSSGARAASSRRSAVRQLLQQIGADPANLDKIGYQAGAWCVRQGRQGNGILLAGKVVKLVSEGNAYGAHVELAASGRPVLVVGKQALPANVDDSVLILGSIVDDPAKNLVGFPTQQPFVIWAGLTLKIEQ